MKKIKILTVVVLAFFLALTSCKQNSTPASEPEPFPKNAYLKVEATVAIFNKASVHAYTIGTSGSGVDIAICDSAGNELTQYTYTKWNVFTVSVGLGSYAEASFSNEYGYKTTLCNTGSDDYNAGDQLFITASDKSGNTLGCTITVQ